MHLVSAVSHNPGPGPSLQSWSRFHERHTHISINHFVVVTARNALVQGYIHSFYYYILYYIDYMHFGIFYKSEPPACISGLVSTMPAKHLLLYFLVFLKFISYIQLFIHLVQSLLTNDTFCSATLYVVFISRVFLFKMG